MKHFKDNQNVSKSMKELRKYKNKIDREEVKLQCVCKHTVNNMPALVSVGSGPNGKEYRCNRCNKPIDIHPVSADKFKSVLAVVDVVCDQLKMQNTGSSKGDRKFLEKVSQTQYALYDLSIIFDAAQNMQNKQNDRKNNNRNGERRRNVTFT